MQTKRLGIKNEGEDCWSSCNKRQGHCPQFCGIKGMCCTKKSGWTDVSNGCNGKFGGSKGHECTLKECHSDSNCDNGEICEEYICRDNRSCCSRLMISSEGLTREFNPSALGTYKLEGVSNGKPSYRGSGGRFLHQTSYPSWMVGNIKGSSSGYLKADCNDSCPSSCSTWKSYESIDSPWTIDETLIIKCLPSDTRGHEQLEFSNSTALITLKEYNEKTYGLRCEGPFNYAFETNFQSMALECSSDVNCKGIWDVDCKGNMFFECSDTVRDSTNSVGCIYRKIIAK